MDLLILGKLGTIATRATFLELKVFGSRFQVHGSKVVRF